jgi:hypothetical protein
MPFVRDNEDFETWLGTQCDVVKPDLKLKHKRMAKSPFLFLRATYFRWARKIEELLPDLAEAPQVLAAGDAHIENFGTWRDAEGRLVWGINDFDDAAVMPYPFDLIRLCTSAKLSPDLKDVDEAAAAILTGYARGLERPRAVILDQHASWLRPFVVPSPYAREEFKKEIKVDPACEPPHGVKAGFNETLPDGAEIEGYATRTKGGGSLGRPRYVAIAKWQGGFVVREAKALVPSGWDWAHQNEGSVQFLKLARGKYRSPDPFLHLHKGFIFRRIAADSRKLDFGGEIPERLQAIFLEVMGRDLGSIHAASKKGAEIVQHLKTLSSGWLQGAAEKADGFVQKDFAKWRQAHPKLVPDRSERKS